MKVRTNYPPYLEAVRRYFTKIFEILVPLQSAYGGPIIGFQVENEYAEYYNASAGLPHMKFLYQVQCVYCACTCTCTYTCRYTK